MYVAIIAAIVAAIAADETGYKLISDMFEVLGINPSLTGENISEIVHDLSEQFAVHAAAVGNGAVFVLDRATSLYHDYVSLFVARFVMPE